MTIVDGLNGTIKLAIEELQAGSTSSGGTGTYSLGEIIVTIMAGLDVNVIWPIYYISSVEYPAGNDTITLDTADATYDRFDAIILTATGLDVITGTPSASPEQPTVDPITELLVTYILVQATQTDLAQDDIVVYDEGTETTITSNNGTLVEQSTAVTPVKGTYVLELGSFNQSHIIDFEYGSDQSIAGITALKYHIHLISGFTNTTYLNISFWKAGVAVSNVVSVTTGIFNFLGTLADEFQLVSIPIGNFTFTDGLFDTVRVRFRGSNASGFYLDYMRLQANVGSNNPAQNFFKTILDDTGQAINASQPNDVLQIIGSTKTGAKELTVSGGSGDVVGPASATDGAVVLYDGTTGKLIKNSTILPTTVGIALANLTNPSAITFIRINADNSVTARTPAQVLSDIGAQAAGSYQPLDATLTALAALATGANKIPYSTGTDTFGQLDLDTDGTLAANSDTKLASQKAVKTYVDAAVSGVGSQDLYIPATAMWPLLTTGCAPLTTVEMATSVLNIQSLDFDQTTIEYAQFTMVLPRNWNNGTVTVNFYWTAVSGSGTVTWAIQGYAYSNDDALTTAFGTAQSVTDTLTSTNDLHISGYTSAITLGGTPADADFLAFQIYRDTADTLNADAKLLGVVITITTDAATA